ncbi:MAG: ECF transporter S component [Clostridia bacterium]|nr:ECF transporter S component [Clostridia bacterium]
MNKGSKKKTDIVKLVGVALLTAIVVVLQYLGSFIKFGPFSISLVLVPIVIGAALYGRSAGAWLGFVFSIVVLLQADTALFYQANFIGTIIVVLLKGTLAGFLAGVVYKALEKKNVTFAVVAAAFTCPVVNTGIFLLGSVVFFMDTIKTWAAGTNVFVFMIVGLVGFNFLFELVTNMLLSPVIVRLIQLGTKAKIKSV